MYSQLAEYIHIAIIIDIAVRTPHRISNIFSSIKFDSLYSLRASRMCGLKQNTDSSKPIISAV